MVTLDPFDDEESQENENLEFTNIDREELQVMNGYINTLVQAMKQDIAEDKMMDSAEVIEVESEEDIDESNVTRKRRQRLASKEARQATKRELSLNSEIDDDGSSNDDNEDDDYKFVGIADDEGEEELDMDNDAIEVVEVESDDDIEVVQVTKRRQQRIASQGAIEATKVELNNVDSDPDDEEEDGDYKFVEKDDEEDLECEDDESDISIDQEVTDSEDETNVHVKKKARKR